VISDLGIHVAIYHITISNTDLSFSPKTWEYFWHDL